MKSGTKAGKGRKWKGRPVAAGNASSIGRVALNLAMVALLAWISIPAMTAAKAHAWPVFAVDYNHASTEPGGDGNFYYIKKSNLSWVIGLVGSHATDIWYKPEMSECPSIKAPIDAYIVVKLDRPENLERYGFKRGTYMGLCKELAMHYVRMG